MFSEAPYRMQSSQQTASNIGRPLLAVTRDQLGHLRSLHFSWQKISKLLRVSISTIQRRQSEFDLEEDNYSDITNEELDSIYRSLATGGGEWLEFRLDSTYTNQYTCKSNKIQSHLPVNYVNLLLAFLSSHTDSHLYS